MKIYGGTKDNREEAAKGFLEKYWKHIYKAGEYWIQDITGKEVKEACREAGRTAGGARWMGPCGHEPPK